MELELTSPIPGFGLGDFMENKFQTPFLHPIATIIVLIGTTDLCFGIGVKLPMDKSVI